jgi:hypothetical protein
MLIGIYPVLFLLAQNALIVKIQSALLPILIYWSIYLVFLWIVRHLLHFTTYGTIIALFIFSIGFNQYGLVFDLLKKMDRFPIEQIFIFVIYLSILLYATYYLTRLVHRIEKPVSSGLMVIYSGLIIYNLYLFFIPAFQKNLTPQIPTPGQSSSQELNNTEVASLPDIYYFVLDEAIGFKQGTEYFDDPEFMEFGKRLEELGFFVAYDSYSHSTNTLHEIAGRLNGMEYPQETETQVLFDAIANNRVFRLLEEFGYTTVVFDQTAIPLFYPLKTPILADVDLVDRNSKAIGYSFAFDGFSQLIFNETLLRPIVQWMAISDPELGRLRESSINILKRVNNLSDIPSPKISYIHLMVTHPPFVFDRDGGPVDPRAMYDWNNYPASYKYLLDQMISISAQIQSNTTPENQPIIIIQSDHGARNTERSYEGLISPILVDYPEEYKKAIINAVYLPGQDYLLLNDQLDPQAVFPLIFERYFGTSIGK